MDVRGMVAPGARSGKLQRYLCLSIRAFGKSRGAANAGSADFVEGVFSRLARQFILPDITLYDESASRMDIEIAIEFQESIVVNGCSIVKLRNISTRQTG